MQMIVHRPTLMVRVRMGLAVATFSAGVSFVTLDAMAQNAPQVSSSTPQDSAVTVFVQIFPWITAGIAALITWLVQHSGAAKIVVSALAGTNRNTEIDVKIYESQDNLAGMVIGGYAVSSATEEDAIETLSFPQLKQVATKTKDYLENHLRSREFGSLVSNHHVSIIRFSFSAKIAVANVGRKPAVTFIEIRKQHRIRYSTEYGQFSLMIEDGASSEPVLLKNGDVTPISLDLVCKFEEDDSLGFGQLAASLSEFLARHHASKLLEPANGDGLNFTIPIEVSVYGPSAVLWRETMQPRHEVQMVQFTIKSEKKSIVDVSKIVSALKEEALEVEKRMPEIISEAARSMAGKRRTEEARGDG
jgi:hypothetical protein